MHLSFHQEKFFNRNPTLIRAEIDDWEIKFKDNKKYISYRISLNHVLFHYCIEKRYSEFQNLYLELRKNHPKILWAVLPKKYYISNFDKEKINFRMKKLNIFLNKILNVYSKNNEIIIIQNFINLHSKNIHSLIDLNMSKIIIKDDITEKYLKLVYQSSEKISKTLLSLRKLIMRKRIKIHTAKLIMLGKDAVISIFVVAFFADNYYDKYLTKIPTIEKRQKSKSMGFDEFDLNIIDDDERIDYKVLSHQTCGLMSQFILDLFDYSKNINADIFRDIFSRMDEKVFKTKYFGKHLCATQNTRCRKNCFEILGIYKNISEHFNKLIIFKNQEDKRQFNAWYNYFKVFSQKDPNYIKNEKFLTMKEILFRNDFTFNYIFQTIDHFKEKNLLNVIINDNDNNLVKISILIQKQKKEKYIKSLLNFEWSDFYLKIYDVKRKGSNYHLDTQIQKKIAYFYKKKDSFDIYYSVIKIYRIDKGSRSVLLFEFLDSYQYRETVMDLVALEKSHIFGRKRIVPDKLDCGTFISIEEYPADYSKTKICILMNHNFHGVDDNSVNLGYLKERIKVFRNFTLNYK